MGRRSRLTTKNVKAALIQSNGFLKRAADSLEVTRLTLSKFIKKNPKTEEFMVAVVIPERGDGYRRTLHHMAMGEVAHEQTKFNKLTGKVERLFYTQPPHYPALMKCLEMEGLYTPKSEVMNKIDPEVVKTLDKVADKLTR